MKMYIVRLNTGVDYEGGNSSIIFGGDYESANKFFQEFNDSVGSHNDYADLALISIDGTLIETVLTKDVNIASHEEEWRSVMLSFNEEQIREIISRNNKVNSMWN